MIKVAIFSSKLNDGGITNLIKSWVKFIDKEEYQIDLITYFEDKDNDYYFKASGCDVHKITSPTMNYLQFKKDINQLFKKFNYHAIHVNNLLNSGFILKEARKNNIPIRICHSHASKDYKEGFVFNVYKKIMRQMIIKNSNCLLSCSEESGVYLYEKAKFKILKNVIDAAKFSFNESINNKMRDKFKLKNNEIVLGTIGMMWEVKNQKYLLEILKQLDDMKEEFKLILVGDGPLKLKLMEEVEKKDLTDKVIFPGWVKNSSDFYSLFNIFLLPSISEGFPLVLLEAQAAGCPCLVSNKITKAVSIGEHTIFLPISENSYSDWIQQILMQCKEKTRKNYVIGTEYDCIVSVKILEKIYKQGISLEGVA